MKMTCEQIRAELKARGLKTAGLKAVIAERLAQAYAKEKDIEQMLTEGHEWIGKAIQRKFSSEITQGKIVAWLPPLGDDMNTARFHIVHEDGDDEIVDFQEAKQAIEESSN